MASFRSRILCRLLWTWGGHRGGGGRLSSTPAGSRVERRGLTYLSGIHLPLDDVEDGDVAVVGLPVPARGHHHVLGLQQPPHHIQDRGLPHTGHLRGQGATGTRPALRAQSTDARTEKSRQHMSPTRLGDSMASLGSVFRFRPLLSLCCGIRNLSHPQLSKLMPLCRSISRSHTAQTLQGAKGKGQRRASQQGSLRVCASPRAQRLVGQQGQEEG